MKILVTGGAGYIGSHTVLALLEKEHDVVVIDNLSNSSIKSLERVKEITNKSAELLREDILDRQCLKNIFDEKNIEAVIHFAGLKAVGESIRQPLEYYKNNVMGSLILLEEMKSAGVKKLIFSSSATVYGEPESTPLTEKAPVGGTTNPYGTSKLMVEQILRDYAQSNPEVSITALRYFNPVGAHESGRIGEDPHGTPNNLLPYIAQVAIGKHEYLSVYGNDYPTPDGTCIRDYIHVMDLAKGHLCAIENMPKKQGFKAYNLGTGKGHSVLEVIKAFETASGKKIPYQVVDPRPGDIAKCWSDATLACNELKWEAKRKLEDMIRDAWNWQKSNPHGYASE